MLNNIVYQFNNSNSGERATSRCVALLVAAGSGKRMGNGNKGKAFVNLNGKTLLEHCLNAFENSKYISEIMVVAKTEDVISAYNYGKGRYKKLTNIIIGGETRQDSVMNGLSKIKNADFVAIHDVARPCIRTELIDKCIKRAVQTGNGATLAVPVSDTIKKVENGKIECDVDRENLWQMQTPQVFPLEKIWKAHKLAKSNGVRVTDDAAIYMIINEKVEIVESTNENLKITYPQDIAICRYKSPNVICLTIEIIF
jgi:2-C-methyl-D-erythritol 4-phosphate cytidylyltransferase